MLLILLFAFLSSVIGWIHASDFLFFIFCLNFFLYNLVFQCLVRDGRIADVELVWDEICGSESSIESMLLILLFTFISLVMGPLHFLSLVMGCLHFIAVPTQDPATVYLHLQRERDLCRGVSQKKKKKTFNFEVEMKILKQSDSSGPNKTLKCIIKISSSSETVRKHQKIFSLTMFYQSNCAKKNLN